MRYFKIEEINEEEYLKNNKSKYYNTPFEQAVVPFEDKYLIAIEDKITNEITINLDWLRR